MKHRLAGIVLISGATLFALVHAAAAAPQDLTRAPDGEVRPCGDGLKCIARAIGDFNGDGIDDLVFQRSTLEPSARGGRAQLVTFDVQLSPWIADSESADPAHQRRASVAKTLVAFGAQDLDPVSVDDVDGDGIDDLIFVLTPSAGALGGGDGSATSGVHVVRGEKNWVPHGRVESAPGYHFSLGLVSAVLTAAFADMNGDGRKDLVLGTDRVSIVSPEGTALASGNQVDIMFNPGAWSATQEIAADASIVGMGACTGSLVAANDVTGDGRADVVTRSCTAGLPDQLRVVTGRASWPPWVSVESGGVNVPRPPTPAPIPTGEVPPPPGGGYLPEPDPGVGSPAPALAVAEDVNGDGLADPSIEFAGKLHVWFGGADVAARLSSGRSSAVIVHAGLGAARLTHSWGMTDINVDGVPDLLLSEPVDGSVNCLSLPCNGVQAPETSRSAVLLYTQHLPGRVVDPTFDAPSAEWMEPGRMLWGLGDFNGDGRDDLFLGSSPGAFDSIYAWAFGPLAPATTRAGVLNPGF